ncbi:MAG TPA: hypothetical protein VGD57_10020, partial [Candidatus Dormibacteraeota bacterium]
ALVQATEPRMTPVDGEDLERTVSSRVTAILMLLLLVVVFVTSAVPDIGPSLAAVFRTHL